MHKELKPHPDAMATLFYSKPNISFGDIFFSGVDRKSVYTLSFAVVGLTASSYFVLHEVYRQLPQYMELETLVFSSVIASFFFIVMISFAHLDFQLKRMLSAVVVLGGVVCADIMVYSWKYMRSVPRHDERQAIGLFYVFVCSLVCTALSVIYILRRALMTRSSSEDYQARGEIYVSRRIKRSPSVFLSKPPLSLSLHPSFQVISSPKDSLLRVRPLVSPAGPTCVDGVFIGHNSTETHSSIDKTTSLARFVESSSSLKLESDCGGIEESFYNPPVVLYMGIGLSLVWLGYCALVAYNTIDAQNLEHLAQELDEDADIVAGAWVTTASSFANLQAVVSALEESGDLDEDRLASLISAMSSVGSALENGSSGAETVYSDLTRYSDWTEVLKQSMILALRIGGAVALPIVSFLVLIPLWSARRIRAQMQAGIWSHSQLPCLLNSCPDSPESVYRSLLSMITTVLGAQMGLAAVGFFCIASIIAIIALVFTFPVSRFFLWSIRFHVVSLVVLCVIGSTLCAIVHQLRLPLHRLSVSTLVLMFYNIIPGQLFGLYRVLCSLVGGLVAAIRVDSPCPFGSVWGDSVYMSFLGLIYFEHMTKNPIVFVATSALKHKWKRKSCNRRAELRWFLAYTLIKNPSLIRHRVRYKNLSGTILASPSSDDSSARSEGGSESHVSSRHSQGTPSAPSTHTPSCSPITPRRNMFSDRDPRPTSEGCTNACRQHRRGSSLGSCPTSMGVAYENSRAKTPSLDGDLATGSSHTRAPLVPSPSTRPSKSSAELRLASLSRPVSAATL